LTIDLNQQEIDQLKVSNFNHAEILVSTYNGTNSLECLLTGRPTIFYWQPEYADYSEIMAPVIKKLREAGVLIEECETLVETLLMESTEIIRWWTTTKVQLAVREYLSLFGNIDGGIARWSGKITDLYMTEYRKDQKPYE